MTDNQRIFCDEYLKDRNAARAYRVAYPRIKSDDAARVNGSKLLTNANVREYIDKQLEKISSEKIADAKEVLEYLTSVMRGQCQAEIVVVEGTGEGCSKARRMDKAPDQKERTDAAKTLAKILGVSTNNLNVNGIHIVIGGEDDLVD